MTANVPVRREWLPDPKEGGLDDEWVLATAYDAVAAERDALRAETLVTHRKPDPAHRYHQNCATCVCQETDETLPPLPKEAL